MHEKYFGEKLNEYFSTKLLYEKIFLLKIIAIHHQIMRILIAIVNTQLVQFKQHELVGCPLHLLPDAKARDLKGKAVNRLIVFYPLLP